MARQTNIRSNCMGTPITGSSGEIADFPLAIQGFAPEEDCSKVDILRYVPLERFLSLLELEAMWFSCLAALQDKFECTNPLGARAFVLKLANDPEAVEKCKALGLWDIMVATAEHGRSGDEGRCMFVVNCWFVGKQESAKMWKEYGDGGKGVAIRSTVRQLRSAFQIPGDLRLVSRVGRVNYVDFESHDLGARGNDIARVAFIKDKAFAEESEVRVLTLNTLHHGCLYPDGSQAGLPGSAIFCPSIKGFHIKCDLKGLMRSIIVGPNSPPYFRMLIKRIVSRYGLTIGVEYSQVPPLG